ncbi:MAG: DUF6445 family protein [Pseudomonadota bacterium]
MSELRIDKLPGSDEPIVVIDDIHPDPQSLVAAARGGDFKPIAPHYPGVRAPVPRGYLDTLIPKLAEPLRDVFGYDKGLRLQECYFSLATTAPSDLKPMQRMPHIDGTDPAKVAVLHYLCGPEHGGTSFYRHRSTGMTRIQADVFQAYRSAVYNDVDRLGMPEAAYPDGDSEMYERTAFYPAQFNRVVIYRGISLHAVSIGSPEMLVVDADAGRLTVNTFLTPAA